MESTACCSGSTTYPSQSDMCWVERLTLEYPAGVWCAASQSVRLAYAQLHGRVWGTIKLPWGSGVQWPWALLDGNFVTPSGVIGISPLIQSIACPAMHVWHGKMCSC